MPASRRAASPAATSAESTLAANRTASKPPSAIRVSRASTRGCGSGLSSSTSSITCTRCAPKRPASAARPSTSKPSSTASASPSEAALPSTPSESFWSLPSWCSRKTRNFMLTTPPGKRVDRSFQTDERAKPVRPEIGIASEASYGLLLCKKLQDLLRCRAVVLDLLDVAAGRRPVQGLHGRARACLARLLGRHAEVGQRKRLLRLLLGAHDPLQRRVARHVDRVRDGDHGRDRRLDHVVAELGLPLAAHLPVRVLELGDLRDQRPLQPVGDRRPEHGAVTVVGLLT